MPNHVHLILVPPHEDSLRAGLLKAHRACAGHIHKREQRTGHFRQGWLVFVAMDSAHLMAAIPCMALNLVRARLVERAEQWPRLGAVNLEALHCYRILERFH